MKPLISVIVPVYKVEKYLDRCVESIVNQTYENLEIILVDDGSPDNCPEMCDAWAEKDNRIKVIHKENGGVSSARNAALDVAKGEYIGFVDSDDFLNNNYFTVLMQENTDNFDIVACNFKCIKDDEFFDNGRVYKDQTVFEANTLLTKYLKENFIYQAVHSKIYKMSVITDNNIKFDVQKKVGEDFLFNYYFLKNSSSVKLIEDNLYNYFVREDSAFHTVSINIINRWKNTKQVLSDIENTDLYSICIVKYQNELLCCLRELLRSKNNDLINQCYDEICDEIKKYSKEFLKLNISKINKLSIRLINLNPKIFKKLYMLYKRTI